MEMKSNAMNLFVTNLILCIIGVNGMLLMRSVIGGVPFRFSIFWGLISPVICATVSALSPFRKASLK